MIAQNNEYLIEASNSIYYMNADERARKRALDREEYYRDIRTWKKQITDQKILIERQQAALAEQDAILMERDAALAERDATIAELKAQLARKE